MKLPTRLRSILFNKSIIGIVLCALIFVVGLKFGSWHQQKKDLNNTQQLIYSIKPIRENNFNYHYIFPLLAYDFTHANQYLRDTDLDNKIDAFVADQAQKQNAESVSVYVRNFSDNHWAGSNEDVQYHPGSILKVLIMMAYFRSAQLDPTILEKKFLYSKDINQQTNSLNFAIASNLSVGQSYSVRALIEDMIANSDNGAETLLISNVNRDILNNAYSDLNIPNPDSVSGDYTISARQYSAFLRILYNSTYLEEDYSEEALSILAKSTYHEGISAGVPSTVQVAQKYGERVNGSNDKIESIELHDCGIVYAPNHPYSICIMTKGQDVTKLTSIIKELSSLVYQNLTSTP